MDSRLVCLHMEGSRVGESFTISRDWLALGGTSLQSQQGPMMSKHQNKKTGLI